MKQRLSILLCGLTVWPFVTSPTSQATPSLAVLGLAQTCKAAPRTVVDYFRLLPRRYTEGEPQHLLRNTITTDLKNDYLQTAGDAGQPGFTTTLFRHNGRVLVALRADYEMGSSLKLLRYEGGQWRDVTKAILPVRYNENNIYELPRYGTTIEVYKGEGEGHDERGRRLYSLDWKNGAFHWRR